MQKGLEEEADIASDNIYYDNYHNLRTELLKNQKDGLTQIPELANRRSKPTTT